MDLTKFSFSDQFPHCVWPKRKVVSGFGLGILGSLIVLSVLLFNVSFNARLLTPMCQGFNTTWPFSFSSSSACSSSPVYNASVETNVTSISKDRNVLGSNGVGKILEKTQFGILPEEAKNRSFTLEEGKIMEKDLFENGSDVGKNANFTFKEGRVTEPGQFLNGSDMGHIANFTSSKGEGAVRETTHLGNSSEKVKSGSVNGGDVTTGKSIIGDNVAEGKSSNREDRATGNKTVANFSCSGDSVGSSEDREFQVGKKSDFNENCDIFDGRWVRDEAKPYFPVGSCPYIDRDFDCYRNGRSDDGFLKWKWLPYGCDIPSLNATDFLERLKGKKLVFVGDSLNRNMWESLVCILRHSVRNKKRVYEISGRRNFKKKGFYAFRFEDYNCSVDFVSSPFLVRESFVKRRNGSFETLRLDLMDRTTSMYRDADIVVFNTGHWWTHEKTSKGEDYYQEGNHVYPRLKVLEAYRKALTTWARWVDTHIERSRTQVIFRGYSVTHFRGGQWSSGGQCHKETEPIFNESYLSNYPTKMKTLDHVIQEMKTPVIYLNISRLTDYRKDGHPSIYRKNYKSDQEKIAAEQSQDCSHWCLPGVPDTWNELLYASLLQTGKGS